MKNSIIGLGIFAFIFSFNLLFSGAVEAKQASQECLYAQFNSNQPETFSDSGEITFHDGILQHKTEGNEVHHVVRKFPALLGVLFLLLNQNIEESPALLFAADHSFFPSKDFPVSFHNLRI